MSSIGNIQNASNTILFISIMMMIVFNVFIALFAWPIAMMIAWVLSAEKTSKKITKEIQ